MMLANISVFKRNIIGSKKTTVANIFKRLQAIKTNPAFDLSKKEK